MPTKLLLWKLSNFHKMKKTHMFETVGVEESLMINHLRMQVMKIVGVKNKDICQVYSGVRDHYVLSADDISLQDKISLNKLIWYSRQWYLKFHQVILKIGYEMSVKIIMFTYRGAKIS